MDKSIYLIAGLGKTGHSIAGYLQRRNKPFVAFDTRREVEGLSEFKADFPGAEVFLGQLPPEIYPQLTAVITSPGVPLEEPFLQEALKRDIPVYGDIECLAREINVPVIAITGTNGKSTVTTLVGEMAKAAGWSVAVAGNIGSPVLDRLDDGQNYNLWVLELSSFQLDLTSSLKPEAAVILNITADHLDRHHSLSAYTEAKQRVYQQAKLCLYNREDELTQPALNTPAMSFGLDAPKVGQWGIVELAQKHYLAYGTERLMSTDELALKGKHNWQNALAASALATALQIDTKQIVETLKTFNGLPHRCQRVRTLNGVDWINDSKGTNVGATISALAGIGGASQGKIVLIAGGLGKGADFTELRDSVSRYARAVILIGKDADKIEAALARTVSLLQADSMENAIKLAKAQAQPGDTVLLSPACASFDMFRDFNHRGEHFAALVKEL